MGNERRSIHALAMQYRNIVVDLLGQIVDDDAGVFDKAVDVIATALASDRLIYVTGSGHSHMLAEEIFYRAGGIAAVQPVLEPELMLHEGARYSTLAERREGIAKRVLDKYPVRAGDVMIVASNSGRNAFPIEIAMLSKDRGAKTIGVTSLRSAEGMTSRHSSGQLLRDVVDIAIDNQAPSGDAALAIPGTTQTMGPVSSLTGIFLLNLLMAQAVAQLARQGKKVDIFRSANGVADGEDPAAVAARWEKRIIGL